MQKALPIGKAFLFSAAASHNKTPSPAPGISHLRVPPSQHRLRRANENGAPSPAPRHLTFRTVRRYFRDDRSVRYVRYVHSSAHGSTGLLTYSLAGALIATGGFADASSSLLFTLSIQRRRIGASRNFAATAAVMLITAAAMNTRSQ